MGIPNEVLDYALTEGVDIANIHCVENEEFLDPTMLSFRRETGFHHCVVGEKYLVIAKNSAINNSIVYTLMGRVNFDILSKILGGKETLGDRLSFCNIEVPPPILIKRDTPEEKKPDTFEVNWDFFAQEDGFEDVIEDPEFRKRAERIAKFSAKAFGNTDVAFLCTHICIGAFLNSYAEEFRAQEEVMDTVGMMLREDILNFGGVFTVGRTNSEFEQAVMFTLGWFEELIRRYAGNGFMGAKDKFGDFIYPFMDENRTLHFEFPQSHFNSSGGYSAGLQIDLQNETMNLRLKDHIAINESRKQGKAIYLSEYLEANNPFLQNHLLNFLLPMGYRGFIFPLFNVNKITLIDIKGSGEEREYAHLSSQSAIETTTVTRTLSQEKRA